MAVILTRRITLELMVVGKEREVGVWCPGFWLSLRRQDGVVLLICVFFTDHRIYVKRDLDAL
jgi:hypothetical protein